MNHANNFKDMFLYRVKSRVNTSLIWLLVPLSITNHFSIVTGVALVASFDHFATTKTVFSLHVSRCPTIQTTTVIIIAGTAQKPIFFPHALFVRFSRGFVSRKKLLCTIYFKICKDRVDSRSMSFRRSFRRRVSEEVWPPRLRFLVVLLTVLLEEASWRK